MFLRVAFEFYHFPLALFILDLDLIKLCVCVCVCVCVHLVTESQLTLCDPMDCTPTGSSVYEDPLEKNIGVGCHALLQGKLLTQRSNPDLPHCRWILYYLSHQESP